MADALASGASVRKDVGVQVPPSAPRIVLKLLNFSTFSLSLLFQFLTDDTLTTKGIFCDSIPPYHQNSVSYSFFHSFYNLRKDVSTMNTIFDKLVKSKIDQFEDEYVNLSRQIFVDKEGKLIHPGEFGTYREKIIKNFLEPFLPSRLAIGSGFIITSKDHISTQCDIIIYDREHTPIIENGEQKFFPIECVAGVIEAKSKLTKSTLKDALIKLSNIKKLREDIEDNPYIFCDYSIQSPFNTKEKVRDQIATFLICESVDFDIAKEMDTLFTSIYQEIDKSLFHNMILSLKNCCFLYHDGTYPIYHSYFDYKNDGIFRNECVFPHETGYEKEHILLFLNYFYMVIASVSIMCLEITNYLGAKRKKTVVLENR